MCGREEQDRREREGVSNHFGPVGKALNFVCLFVCFCFHFGLCFVASDVLTTICHLAIVNVCVIIILSIGNTQVSILLLCFLYLFVELMITMNE